MRSEFNYGYAQNDAESLDLPATSCAGQFSSHGLSQTTSDGLKYHNCEVRYLEHHRIEPEERHSQLIC